VVVDAVDPELLDELLECSVLDPVLLDDDAVLLSPEEWVPVDTEPVWLDELELLEDRVDPSLDEIMEPVRDVVALWLVRFVLSLTFDVSVAVLVFVRPVVSLTSVEVVDEAALPVVPVRVTLRPVDPLAVEVFARVVMDVVWPPPPSWPPPSRRPPTIPASLPEQSASTTTSPVSPTARPARSSGVSRLVGFLMVDLLGLRMAQTLPNGLTSSRRPSSGSVSSCAPCGKPGGCSARCSLEASPAEMNPARCEPA